MRLPFFRKKAPSGRKVYRLSRSVRAPAENPYFNKRLQRRALRLAPFAASGLGVVAVLVAGVLLISLPQLRVTRISIEGHSRIARSTVQEAVEREYERRLLGIFPRRNYFLLRTGRLGDDLQAIPEVAAADVAKSFPDRLTIRIEERAAAYALFTDDARALADESGIVFALFPGEGEGRPAFASTTPALSGSSTGTPVMGSSSHSLSFLTTLVRSRGTSTLFTLYDTSNPEIVLGQAMVPQRIRTLADGLVTAFRELDLGVAVVGGIYDGNRQHELTAVTSEGWAVIMDPIFDMERPLQALSGVLREKITDRSGLTYIDVRYQDRVYYK